MAIHITKDTKIATLIAPWLAREKKAKSPIVQGTFERWARFAGPYIEPPRPWPFGNALGDGTHDSDFRIRLNNRPHNLLVVVKLVDDDGEVMQYVVPVALRHYWEKHFKAEWTQQQIAKYSSKGDVK